MALLLTALTQLLHAAHFDVLARLDHFFTSIVVSGLHDGEADTADRPDARADGFAVQLIELGADLRARHMEAAEPDPETVLRLDGVRPIERSTMARLLQALADCLADTGPKSCVGAQRPAVLAIDVDLAPLPDDGADSRAAMLAALDSLRRSVQVLVIALDRPDAKGRKLRNDFIVQAGELRGPPPDRPLKGLYFASPRLLHRAQEAPLQYLGKARDGSLHFPALGNLMHLAWRPGPGDLPSLTQLREQAATGHLQEDGLSPAAEAAPGLTVKALAQQYKSHYFNWPLLSSEAFYFTPLSARKVLNVKWFDDAISQLQEQGLRAPVLILSVEGGGSNDKFATPGALSRPVSGATLHALQALSRQQPLYAASWQGALADLLLGAAMVLVTAVLHVHVFAHWHEQLPGITRLCVAVTALLMVLVFGWLGVQAARGLMSHCALWFNPLYVVVGLALHAYAEAWDSAPEQPHEHGLLRLLRDWFIWPDFHPRRHRVDRWLVYLLRTAILLGGICALIYASFKH